MTKDEAIELMKLGNRLTHQYFTSDEWITIDADGFIVTEEGYKCTPDEFWSYRTDSRWERDWEIFIDDLM